MWWVLLALVLWLSGRFDEEVAAVVSTLAIGLAKLLAYCGFGVVLLCLCVMLHSV